MTPAQPGDAAASPNRAWTRAAVQRLVGRIEAAFPEAAPPPYDPSLDMLSPEDRTPFRRRRWRDIVTDRLPYDAVFFFDDEPFRYYLPAYLVTALRWPRRAANVRSSSVASLVAPGPGDPELARFRARMDAFTPDQKQVIRDFLLCMQAFDRIDPRAGRALRRYWNAAAKQRRGQAVIGA